MDFHQQLRGKFLKLTELCHVNSERNEFSSRVPKTIKYGTVTETISFLAPKVWSLVPGKIKECSSSEAFKSKIGK